LRNKNDHCIANDQKTIETVQKLSPEAFKVAYQKGEIELCGAAAVLTLLELSQLHGEGECINLHYANSGEQTHDQTDVVGYNASLVGVSDKISTTQSDILLNLAKDSLAAYLKNQTMPRFLIDDPVLTQNRAVFVTLRSKTGELRGCIGRFEAEEPLYLAVQHMTIEAATKDSRFAPLVLYDMQGLSIEISVLDSPVLVNSPHDIIYGTHGVILSQGSRQGVFLPEVSKEFKTREDFLGELCLKKADLPRNCWQNPQTQIRVFTTQTIQKKG
jgi:AmmeMemoRadiSam system protein A